jgi:hypothetical protein
MHVAPEAWLAVWQKLFVPAGLGSPRHICAGTGLPPATSVPGLGSPPPHLHRGWALPRHICAGTWLAPPHLHGDWVYPTHICAGTRLTPATSAPGLGQGAQQRAYALAVGK